MGLSWRRVGIINFAILILAFLSSLSAYADLSPDEQVQQWLEGYNALKKDPRTGLFLIGQNDGRPYVGQAGFMRNTFREDGHLHGRWEVRLKALQDHLWEGTLLGSRIHKEHKDLWRELWSYMTPGYAEYELMRMALVYPGSDEDRVSPDTWRHFLEALAKYKELLESQFQRVPIDEIADIDLSKFKVDAMTYVSDRVRPEANEEVLHLGHKIRWMANDLMRAM